MLKYLVVVDVTPQEGEPYRKVLVIYARDPADAAATAEAIGRKAPDLLDTRALGVHKPPQDSE